jgi:hypothetical protein
MFEPYSGRLTSVALPNQSLLAIQCQMFEPYSGRLTSVALPNQSLLTLDYLKLMSSRLRPGGLLLFSLSLEFTLVVV